MTSKAKFTHYNSIDSGGNYEVVLEIKDIRKDLLGRPEVLVKGRAIWRGQEDTTQLEGWLRIGDTFTVTKTFMLA